MIEFLKKLEERVNSEREKMVGKAILYAENSEPSNRNGYMTHKYVSNVLKEIVSEYKDELSKMLAKQEEARQQEEKLASLRADSKKRENDVKSSQSVVAKEMLKQNALSNVTLGSNLKKSKKSDDNNDDVVAPPISDSKPKRKKPAPKKVPSKKKVDGDSSNKGK